MPRKVQPVEQREEHKEEKRTSTHRPAHAHRRTVDTYFISMAVGATNDRLPIDSHWNGRWNAGGITAATGDERDNLDSRKSLT